MAPVRGPPPARRRQRCIPNGGSRVTFRPVDTVPRRPTTDHGPAGTAFFPQTITCQTASDARSVRSALPSTSCTCSVRGWTQNAPPGTRRRWGVWYRSRIVDGGRTLWSAPSTLGPCTVVEPRLPVTRHAALSQLERRHERRRAAMISLRLAPDHSALAARDRPRAHGAPDRARGRVAARGGSAEAGPPGAVESGDRGCHVLALLLPIGVMGAGTGRVAGRRSFRNAKSRRR